jgi:serine/threonine protein kinase
MTPVGTLIKSGEIKIEELSQLINFLQFVHTQCGIVHRDIRNQNLVSEKNLILIDWDFAVEKNQRFIYQGAKKKGFYF